MASRSLNTLYSWAIPKWKPTAAQVRDWFDSFFHKDEQIPINSVAGLADALNALPDTAAVQTLIDELQMMQDAVYGVEMIINGDAPIAIAAGKVLDKILVKPSALITLKIGSAAGLDDVVAEGDVDTDGEMIRIDLVALNAKTIYVSGITAQTTLKLYLIPA